MLSAGKKIIIIGAGKGESERKRNKKQITSLTLETAFCEYKGSILPGEMQEYIHAVLFVTPLSSVPTASIFHMQQINFTFSAGFPFRDQPTS